MKHVREGLQYESSLLSLFQGMPLQHYCCYCQVLSKHQVSYKHWKVQAFQESAPHLYYPESLVFLAYQWLRCKTICHFSPLSTIISIDTHLWGWNQSKGHTSTGPPKIRFGHFNANCMNLTIAGFDAATKKTSHSVPQDTCLVSGSMVQIVGRV